MKKQQYSDQSTLPIDLAFEIVSSLEATDVCSLGSCSKFWNQICGSDSLWESLCKQRWPSSLLAILDYQQDSSPDKSHCTTDFDQHNDSHLNNKGTWREIYLKKHTEMAEKMASYRKSLTTSESCVVDIDDYLKVIEDMKRTMEFGFNDVNIFFFKSNKANVLLNLAGLHYCIKHLNLQVEDVLEAITLNNIEEKQVCIQWRRKGGWMHRFPLPDQIHRRCLSLKELIIAIKGNEALDVLDRGLTAVMVQIQISSSVPECSTMGSGGGGGGGGGCEFTYVLPYWESTPQIQA